MFDSMENTGSDGRVLWGSKITDKSVAEKYPVMTSDYSEALGSLFKNDIGHFKPFFRNPLIQKVTNHSGTNRSIETLQKA